MAMTAADMAEPVIASSNRYADLEPYVKALFKEDPQLWIPVLPWHFPQNGSKEQEEEFLRRFFTDREIRMQGGADPPGNGYKFLKQVWYCAAKWNLEFRLPAIVSWWFENNQEVLNDPNMMQHFFNEGVQPSTFFEANEINTYGEELLGWAVKMIQTHIRSQGEPQAPASTEGDTPAQAPTEQGDTQEAQGAAQPAPATTADQAAATTTAEATPSPSLPASTAPPPAMPTTAGHEQGFQDRNFSSGSYPSEDRPQPYRRGRGNFSNKRNSFNQPRPAQRPPHTFGDTRHMSNPYSPYGPPSAQLGPMPPGSAPITHRIPSGGPFPSPVVPMPMPMPMPTLPQGQQFHGAPPLPTPMTPQYGAPMLQMQHPQQQMFVPGGAYPAGNLPHGVPTAYMQPQPFGDRSNVHPDSRNFNGEQQFFAMEDKQDYRNKRRDSVQSRSGRARGGYGGSMRGRGSRGRNSFGAEGQSARAAPNETNVPFPQHDRRFSVHHEKNWRRADGQAENFMPQDARQVVPGYGGYQMPHYGGAMVGSNPNDPRSTGGMPIRAAPGMMPPHHESKPCTAGCTREHISDTCQDVPKLIVFNVPPSIEMGPARHYFSQFGQVLSLSTPKLSQNDHLPERHYMWLTFADTSGPRSCMASNGAQWPGGTLLLEVARDHWDPDYVPKNKMGYRTMNQAGGPPVTALPPRPMYGTPQQPVSDHQPPSAQNDLQPGYTKPDPDFSAATDAPNATTSKEATPTASGVSTPNKKGKNKNKNKNKNRKGSKNSEANPTPGRKDSEDEPRPDTAGAAKKSSPTSSENDEVKKTEESTPPVLDAPSPRAGDAEDEVANETNPDVGEGAETTPVAATSDPVIAAMPEPSVTPKPEAAESVTEPPAATNKQDEDQNEDSFHTASGSPGAEADDVEATTPTAPVGPEQEIEEDKKSAPASAPASDAGSAHGSGAALSNTSVKSPSPSRNVTKAPIPRVPSQKNVTISVPHVDTEKAKALGEASNDLLQVPPQRSASGNSDATTAVFVTAPNTPAVPDPAPEPRSKKESKQKEQQQRDTKQKGPEQTESFSIFAKPKDKRKASKAVGKKAAGKRKGSVFNTPETPEITASSEKGSDTPQESEKLDTQHEESVHQQDATLSTVSTAASSNASALNDASETKTEAAVPQITSDDVLAEEEMTQEKGVKAAGKKPVGRSEAKTTDKLDTVAQPSQGYGGQSGGQKQEGGAAGLGITGVTEATDAAGKKKKGSKGKKGKKRPAEAVVTEMSHPGVDNHASTSNFEFKGNDVDNGSEKPSQTTDQDQNQDHSDTASSGSGPGSSIMDKARHHLRATGATGSDSISRSPPSASPLDADRTRNEVTIRNTSKAKIEEVSAEADSPEVASSKQKLAELEDEEKKAAIKAKAKETEAQ